MIDNNPMIEIRNVRRDISNESRNASKVRVVDVLRLVGELMVVDVTASAQERNWDSVPRVLVMITAAVVLLGMTGSIERVIELQAVPVVDVHPLEEITKFGRQSSRSDQLHIAWISAGKVARLSPADHVDIELSDDRVARDECGEGCRRSP
jgi:hypothetical protein